ncbi:MAG: SGNH/GDSL hydrolase family protein [Candidatus Saccharimonadales bacterium]
MATNAKYAYAETSLEWLSPSLLSLTKLNEVAVIPLSVNGNIDCTQKETSECVVNALYGSVASNGRIKLNNTSVYKTVINYLNNLPRILAIPNSSSIISYSTEPPYGFYLYFNKNFNASISPYTPIGSTEMQYQINRPPDARLEDRNHNRLAADYNSMSFSTDGKWMVVSQPNVSVLRVNLETYEVLPFAPGFNHTIGIAPNPKTAITNDGRYAVVASRDFGRFTIYDLSTCATVPATITGSVTCQSRSLLSFVQTQIPGYITASRIRFIDNQSLSFYASYNDGGGNKIAKFVLKSGGGTFNQIEYLALGDSYISGEGAFNYLEGTDTENNKCHLSTASYPYLIGYTLNYNSYRSIACSGSRVSDITDSSTHYKGQNMNKVERQNLGSPKINEILEMFQPGYIYQLNFVSKYLPKTVTVSIGGNNIGFSQIVKKCIAPDTCFSSFEDRLELVRRVNRTFPDLVGTYQEIKNATSPDAKVFAVGYPQLALPGGNCALNVRLDSQELEFSKQLISYMNLVISRAAQKAGVIYVDTEDAFSGHLLCETVSSDVAVNGLTLGDDFPDFLNGPIGNESYHPNQLGHQLLKQKILAATQNFTQTMPTPNLAITFPPESGLSILDYPPSGRVVRSSIDADQLVDDVLIKGVATTLTIDNPAYPLKPSSVFEAVLHSDPINIGSYTSSSAGTLSFQFQIPDSVSPGFHDLHLYGQNMSGEQIDIYKTVYVGASSDDLDGDGILNSFDTCNGIVPSGVDYDQDDIDDACDGLIGEAPPPPSDPDPPPPIPDPSSSSPEDDEPSPPNSSPDRLDNSHSDEIPVGSITQTNNQNDSAFINTFIHLRLPRDSDKQLRSSVLSVQNSKGTVKDSSFGFPMKAGVTLAAIVTALVARAVVRR